MTARIHVVFGLEFAVFVALGCLLAFLEWRGASVPALRRARTALISFVVIATLGAGVTQVDSWPFSSWSLMTGTPSPLVGERSNQIRVVAVSGAGEFTVDYRAVEPFAVEELMAWLRGPFFLLAMPQRDSAAAFLLARVESARGRVQQGLPPGRQGRMLGLFRAPFHQLHPVRWSQPSDVPATPFIGIRIYGEVWSLEERRADHSKVTRRLLYEFRERE